jgi:hypothetical protein
LLGLLSDVVMRRGSTTGLHRPTARSPMGRRLGHLSGTRIALSAIAALTLTRATSLARTADLTSANRHERGRLCQARSRGIHSVSPPFGGWFFDISGGQMTMRMFSSQQFRSPQWRCHRRRKPRMDQCRALCRARSRALRRSVKVLCKAPAGGTSRGAGRRSGDGRSGKRYCHGC